MLIELTNSREIIVLPVFTGSNFFFCRKVYPFATILGYKQNLKVYVCDQNCMTYVGSSHALKTKNQLFKRITLLSKLV